MTEPVPTDENLRKVRERVMQLAREIEQMSGQNIPPQVFFQEFLTRVVTAVGARAGAVWMIEDSGRLGIAAQVNLDQTGLRERPGAIQLNEKLLVDVLQTGEARTINHGGEARLPTEHILVLSALHKEKTVWVLWNCSSDRMCLLRHSPVICSSLSRCADTPRGSSKANVEISLNLRI